MERALVVVEDSENSRAMVHEAGKFASCEESELVLYAEATQSDVSEATTVASSAGEGDIPDPASRDAIDSIYRFLEGVAEEQFHGLELQYETTCSIVPENHHSGSVLRTAENNNCDHLFVVGEQRSPTGKAVFGDFVQSLLLNFDGRVTVELE